MRKFFLFLFLLPSVIVTQAQSKVFKEVSEEVSSEMKIITQDNALVGYLVFTQLEKANEDSFNYRISLMDENLNDIGAVNFREENLNLEAVSLEQDILCLAYLKSNINNREFKNREEYRKFEAKNAVFLQFLTLDGKIIKTNSKDVSLQDLEYTETKAKRKFTYFGSLVKNIQLRNISHQGFVCFYADQVGRNLVSYDLTGKELWKKEPAYAELFSLLTTKEDVYILQKSNKTDESGFSISGYNGKDGSEYAKIGLTDKKGNQLKVLAWGNDPVTGNPFVSGNILDPGKSRIITSNDLARGPYAGVFTMNIAGHTDKEIKKTFVYWDDGSQGSVVSSKGFIYSPRSYTRMSSSFRDFNDNTYFIGSEYVRRPKPVAIAAAAAVSAIAFIPPFTPGALVMGGIVILFTGTKKWKMRDALVMKLDAKGVLSFENSIPLKNSKYIRGSRPLYMLNAERSYYSIQNPDTKTNFIIAEDSKDIRIYNVKKKKVVRTIPQKEGKVRTQVFPAKEGHIMIVETNKKEKYTRLSIEVLN